MTRNQQKEKEIVVQIKVVPGSSRTVLAGSLDGMLKIKVAAVPEKGKANECLTRFLAKLLNISQKHISIISGLTNPVKKVRIQRISRTEFNELLRRSE